MNLVFKEYLTFLKDKGIDIEKYKLQEGYYWLDNSIIKAYDKQGNIHKIVRLSIDDDLNITTKDYKVKKNDTVFEIESWNETVERNKERLDNLEYESLELIKGSIEKYKGYKPIVTTSTGKDSQLVVYLTEKLIKPRKLFNNTSLDVADTYRFVKQMKDVEIINPKEGYYVWRKRNNIINTRLNRGCCTIFKELATINYLEKDEKYLFFMGMRNDESNARSGYIDEWKNEKWGDREWQGILPIRKWNEENVWLYTLYKNIPINPKYFKGYNRCGCGIVCPNYSKATWILDKYWYPYLYNRFHNILKNDFKNNYKWTRINCTEKEYHINFNGGLIRKEPTEEVLKEFADYKFKDNWDMWDEDGNLKISLEKVKEMYFNHECKECAKSDKHKKVNSKDVIAMNLKWNGRATDEFYCKKHLMERLQINKEEWDNQVKKFKDQGCSLF